jgi:hypothetical protein
VTWPVVPEPPELLPELLPELPLELLPELLPEPPLEPLPELELEVEELDVPLPPPQLDTPITADIARISAFADRVRWFK